jgi:hypothetical protein
MTGSTGLGSMIWTAPIGLPSLDTYALNLTGVGDGRSDPAVYGVVQSLYGAI